MKRLVGIFILVLFFIHLLLPTLHAELWPTLEQYVKDCVLIVKCKTEQKGDTFIYRVIETWKGNYSPDLFYEHPPEDYLYTNTWHGNKNPKRGREVIFFFTSRNQSADGRLQSHSTAFPIKDGKVVYASTNITLQETYTVENFKKVISEITTTQSKDQPLQLTIKSDKEVYGVGESISIGSEMRNILDRIIKLSNYYKPTGLLIYLNNEYKQECVLKYADVFRPIMPTTLRPNESKEMGSVVFSLPNNVTKQKDYKVTGKHSIYMIDDTFTSNTIQIEVVGKKKGGITKDAAVEIAKKKLQTESFADDVDVSRVTVKFREKLNDYYVDFSWKGASDITRRGMWARGYRVVIDVDTGDIKEAGAYKR